jgi:hypothetical protein
MGPLAAGAGRSQRPSMSRTAAVSWRPPRRLRPPRGPARSATGSFRPRIPRSRDARSCYLLGRLDPVSIFGRFTQLTHSTVAYRPARALVSLFLLVRHRSRCVWPGGGSLDLVVETPVVSPADRPSPTAASPSSSSSTTAASRTPGPSAAPTTTPLAARAHGGAHDGVVARPRCAGAALSTMRRTCTSASVDRNVANLARAATGAADLDARIAVGRLRWCV